MRLWLLLALAAGARGAALPSAAAAGQALRRTGRTAIGGVAGLGQRFGLYIKQDFDTNRDGEVSVDELEKGLGRWRQRFQNFVAKLRRGFEKHRHSWLALAGLLGLLYGNHLAHSVLFVRVFSSSGWPLASAGLQRAVDNYESAKSRLPRDMSKVAPLREELNRVSAQVGLILWHALSDDVIVLSHAVRACS